MSCKKQFGVLFSKAGEALPPTVVGPSGENVSGGSPRTRPEPHISFESMWVAHSRRPFWTLGGGVLLILLVTPAFSPSPLPL